MTRYSGDVVIVGAGLVGLALAFELAGRGANVRVFDRAQPGNAASWAGAGMLAPRTETIEDPDLQTLWERSLAAYPAFADAVRAESGVDPKLRLDGIVHAAYDAASLDALRERALVLGDGGELCDRGRALALEPALGHHVAGALLVRGEGQIDNRRLVRALLAACRRRGVAVHANERAALVCDARRVLGVRAERGFVPAGAVVNAAGARADELEGVPEPLVPAMLPVKGEMLAISVPRGFMRHVTWVPGAYLVPREDGRVLVGATSVEGATDTRTTARGQHRLLHAALEAVPALRDFTVTESWAGVRPGTADGRPYLGPTALDGYLLATGHYRNGILLAPVTATLIADAIEGNAQACAPFAPGRGTEAGARART